MFSPQGPLFALNLTAFLLCCKGIHAKLRQPSFPTQLAVFDPCLQTNADVFTIQTENHIDSYTIFFHNLNNARSSSFDKRKSNSCLAYLFSLLISASGDVR